MPGKVYQRIKRCNPQQGGDRQVADVFLENIALGNEWFQGKGQEHNNGNDPSPESEADWRNAFIESAGNNKIARPESRCADGE